MGDCSVAGTSSEMLLGPWAGGKHGQGRSTQKLPPAASPTFPSLVLSTLCLIKPRPLPSTIQPSLPTLLSPCHISGIFPMWIRRFLSSPPPRALRRYAGRRLEKHSPNGQTASSDSLCTGMSRRRILPPPYPHTKLPACSATGRGPGGTRRGEVRAINSTINFHFAAKLPSPLLLPFSL